MLFLTVIILTKEENVNCVVRVSMSLSRTLFMYGSQCCPSFYVTWSHFRCVQVSMLPECPSHLVTRPLCMGTCGSEFLCRLVSLPFCMNHSFDRGSMAFGRTFAMYGPYVLRVSMSFGLTFVLMCLYVVWLSMSHDLT